MPVLYWALPGSPGLSLVLGDMQVKKNEEGNWCFKTYC